MASPRASSAPWLSVVLPTRNRPTLALLGARSVLDALGPGVELLLADNNDVPGSWPDDPRVRVLGTDRVLSMSENWERAIREVRGQWVMVLGDKMRLVPSALAHLERLTSLGAPAIIYKRAKFYQDLTPEQASDPESAAAGPGKLSFPQAQSPYRWRSSRDALRRLHQTFDYLEDTPMLYNALVRRDIIDRALAHAGRMFLGPYPDVSSALVITALSERYLDTNVPLVLEQFPTTELGNWSNGVAHTQRDPSVKRFWSEVGASMDAAPDTWCHKNFANLLAFHERWAEEVAPLELPWGLYGSWSAHEISRFDDAHERRMQWLRAARYLARPRPHARALARLAGSYALARGRRLLAGQPAPPAPQPLESVSASSLPDALRQLDERCARLLERPGLDG